MKRQTYLGKLSSSLGTRALAIRLLEQVAAVRKREKTGFVFFTLDPRAEGALPLVAKALKQGQ